MKDFISVGEARALIDQATDATGTMRDVENVPLMEAVGRTLGKDIYSSSDHPSFANSAMDGYAVSLRAGGKGLRYAVVGESRAGWPYAGRLQAGEAISISTGAVIPDGTEVVVPVELVEEFETDAVVFREIPAAGSHIRLPGKDIRAGTLAFARGTRVKRTSLPLLAMLGVGSVPVYRRPRLFIITTGDELVDFSTPDPIPPGKIRDSNAVALATMAEGVGAEVIGTARAADTPEDLKRAIRAAARAEVIVLSGGISVGPHDHARQTLKEEGIALRFWRVRQRPGKPIAFGVWRDRFVFALPGNPVSSAICFDQYVRRVIRRLLDRPEDPERGATALLDEALELKPDLYHFVRGKAWTDEQARLWVRSTGAQDSNLISSVARANCLIHVEEGAAPLRSGQTVRIEWFRYRGY